MGNKVEQQLFVISSQRDRAIVIEMAIAIALYEGFQVSVGAFDWLAWSVAERRSNDRTINPMAVRWATLARECLKIVKSHRHPIG